MNYRINNGGNPPPLATGVLGFEKYYSVTPDGRVFSNNYRCMGVAKELAQSIHPEGYKKVKAYFIDKRSPVPVHRLVALTFLPNPLHLPQVNHINCDKGDNRVENLEWCDNAWNQKHAFLTGMHVYAKGAQHAMAKLTEAQAVEIKKRITDAPYLGQGKALAREFGVS